MSSHVHHVPRDRAARSVVATAGALLVGALYVDSANSVESDGWLALGLRAEWDIPALGAVAFAEARNLTDELYSPTFSVDDAAGRYFQPADGRSLYAGVRWRP